MTVMAAAVVALVLLVSGVVLALAFSKVWPPCSTSVMVTLAAVLGPALKTVMV